MHCFSKFGRYAASLSLLLAMSTEPAAAQLLPSPGQVQPTEFMTVLVFESDVKSYNKLLFAPAFKGRTEIELAGTNTFTTTKAMENQRFNAEAVNRTLSELSAAGWELVEVYSLPWVRD